MFLEIIEYQLHIPAVFDRERVRAEVSQVQLMPGCKRKPRSSSSSSEKNLTSKVEFVGFFLWKLPAD